MAALFSILESGLGLAHTLPPYGGGDARSASDEIAPRNATLRTA